jgi:hypothetical protein
MKQPHKHADLIKAWADGAEIEFRVAPGCGEWKTAKHLIWADDVEYRIKPDIKPDVVIYYVFDKHGGLFRWHVTKQQANLSLTFDGETGELKSAEVIK